MLCVIIGLETKQVSKFLVPEVSQFGIAGAVVIVVYLFLIYLRDDRKQRSADNAKRDEASQVMSHAIERNSRAIDRNTKSTDESLKFLKNLNGRLEKAVSDKLQSK